MTFKRKFLIAASTAGALAMASGAAFAADPVEAGYDWSGFYFGAHFGYGGADVSGDFDLSDGAGDFVLDTSGSFDLDPEGILGGAQAGFNWQTGNFVLGVEADVSFTDWDDDLSNADLETVSVDTDFLATLRLRAGFAADNLLFYATAGAAITDTEFTAVNFTPADSGSVDLDDIGFVFGAGIEWAFASNFSAKIEGLYFIFDDRQGTATLTSDSDPGDNAELEDAWLVRAGLNFHF